MPYCEVVGEIHFFVMPGDNYTYFLIRSLKKNDKASLEKLYSLYYSKLYRFAQKFSSSTIDPEDFVQQTFLAIWEKRAQLNEDIIFDKQIFTICKNIILNQIKRDKKVTYRSDTFEFPEDTGDNSSHAPVTEDLNNKGSNKIKQLNTAIAKLPEKRREILILHKFENLTYEEIGQFLNISKKTIANQIYIALLFLKKELNKKNS